MYPLTMTFNSRSAALARHWTWLRFTSKSRLQCKHSKNPFNSNLLSWPFPHKARHVSTAQPTTLILHFLTSILCLDSAPAIAESRPVDSFPHGREAAGATTLEHGSTSAFYFLAVDGHKPRTHRAQRRRTPPVGLDVPRHVGYVLLVPWPLRLDLELVFPRKRIGTRAFGSHAPRKTHRSCCRASPPFGASTQSLHSLCYLAHLAHEFAELLAEAAVATLATAIPPVFCDARKSTSTARQSFIGFPESNWLTAALTR